MNFTVEQNGTTMQCRLFQRTGGYRGGKWVLTGYVGHEERMECDVTTTVRAHGGNRERLTKEIRATAEHRLAQIASESTQQLN